MINKVILVGNVGKDPEAYADGKLRIFSLATNRNFKDKAGEWQKETIWHNIKCWGNQADYINGRVTKGALVYVEGAIEENTYTTDDGLKKVQYSIRANEVRVLSALEKKEATQDQSEEAPF